jgi:hypothetical protein
MNTGLQDAYNFAWKLALVISGTATDALLDSYAGERMPVAERLLRTTDRAFAFVVSEGRMAGLLRAKVIARVLAFAMGFQRVRRVGFRTISQIGIRYARSSLSQTLPGLPAKAARGGDRFPWVRLQLSPDGPPQDLFQKLDDTRFNLLLIGSREDAATDELKRLMLVHTVPDTPENRKALGRAGIPFPSFYLLRPDGYIALAGSRLEGGVLEGYLASRLGLKRARENVVRTGSIAS